MPWNRACIYLLICPFYLPEIPRNNTTRMMTWTCTFVSIHRKQCKPNVSNVFLFFLWWIIIPYFNILDLYQIRWSDLNSRHFEENNLLFLWLALCEGEVQVPKCALFWQNLQGFMKTLCPSNYVKSETVKVKPLTCGLVSSSFHSELWFLILGSTLKHNIWFSGCQQRYC